MSIDTTTTTAHDAECRELFRQSIQEYPSEWKAAVKEYRESVEKANLCLQEFANPEGKYLYDFTAHKFELIDEYWGIGECWEVDPDKRNYLLREGFQTYEEAKNSAACNYRQTLIARLVGKMPEEKWTFSKWAKLQIFLLKKSPWQSSGCSLIPQKLDNLFRKIEESLPIKTPEQKELNRKDKLLRKGLQDGIKLQIELLSAHLLRLNIESQ
jgi:hypothetical protein